MNRADHPLDGEQQAAVAAACSGRAFSVIEGWAGTGKSTTLRTVVDAYLGRGTDTEAVADHVYALACAGLAAHPGGRQSRGEWALSCGDTRLEGRVRARSLW